MQIERAADSERCSNRGEHLVGTCGGRWLLAAAILVVLVLTTNYALLMGKVSPQWDALDFFGPAFSLVSDHIRAHQLLLWDPWTSGGTPDFAEPELGSTSPVLLAAAAVIRHPRTGFVTYWMIVWIGAGLGMLGLTRHLRCPWWGGVITSLGFVSSGFFLNHAQHMSSLYSIAFLPWICWRLDDALLTKRYWSAAQAGVLYGLSALGGYPQFTIITSGFLALWTIGRFLFPEDIESEAGLQAGKPRFLQALLKLSLVGVIGVLILCPSYLGFMTETHGYSDRVGHRSRIESTTSNFLPAGAISTLASPYISMLAHPSVPNRLWPASDVSMSSIYCGSVVLILAVMALLQRSAWRWWLAFLIVLFLCCSLGSQLPLRGWIYDLIPATRYFRNASMFSAYGIFSVDILAALATRDLSASRGVTSRKPLVFFVISTTAAIASVVVFSGLTAGFGKPPFDYHLAVIQLILTWWVIALLGFLSVVQVVSWRQAFQALVVIGIMDAAMTIIVSQPVMYGPSTNAPWRIMADKHVTDIDLTSMGMQRYFKIPPSIADVDVPSNENLPFKVPTLDSYIVFGNRFGSAFNDDPSLISFALGDNRTWFSPSAAQLPPADSLFNVFAALLRERHSPLLVVHTADEMRKLSVNDGAQGAPSEQQQSTTNASLNQLAPASPIRVQLNTYTPNALAFTVTAPSAGWLMVTDRWAPGWKAEVNGQPATVYGADFLFRAVRVNPGNNVVRFWYEPRTWLPSLIVSWGTLSLFLLMSLIRPQLGEIWELTGLSPIVSAWKTTICGVLSELWSNARQRILAYCTSWFLAAAVVVILLLAANYPLLIGQMSPQWDAVNYFGPSFSLVSDHIRAHRLVLWDPWTSAGTPDFAEPQLGSTAPVLLATAAIFKHPRTGFIIYWMVIWIGAGLGMLVLTRHLRSPWWGGLIASLGYTTSGFFLNHAQHISWLYSFAFLPWICWRFDDSLLTRRYWSAVQAGILYGLSALGGYPEFTILTSLFLGLWTIGRLFFSEPDIEADVTLQPRRPRFVPAILKLVMVGIVGVLVLCPSYLGFMTETHGYSDRVGERSKIEATSSNLLPAGAIATLTSPYLSMLSYPGLPNRLWPISDISMSSIYCGSVVLVLAVMALLRRSAWRWWLAFLALLFLCASLGSQTPLRGWIYDLIAPTRYFRNASMFSAYTIFLFDILAALAARDLFASNVLTRGKQRIFLAITAIATIASLAVFAGTTSTFSTPPFAFHLAVVQLFFTWCGIFIVTFLLLLRVFSLRHALLSLVVISILDAGLTIAVSRPVMYSSADSESWRHMAHKHVSDIDQTSRGLYRSLNVPLSISDIPAPNNDNLPPKLLVLHSYEVFFNRFETALESNPASSSFALGNDRMWFAPEAAQLPPSDSVFNVFQSQLRERRSPVLIVHSADEMAALSSKPAMKKTPPDQRTSNAAASLTQLAPASAVPVQLTSYTPNQLAFTFDAPSAGWLMVTDRWAPGWKAAVNGQPATVYGADFLFRAVRVDVGTNVIRFWYEPRTWLPSLIVSWGTLLIFIAASLIRAVRAHTGTGKGRGGA